MDSWGWENPKNPRYCCIPVPPEQFLGIPWPSSCQTPGSHIYRLSARDLHAPGTSDGTSVVTWLELRVQVQVPSPIPHTGADLQRP